MPFIKLDKTIITSSLWTNADTTLLFITALVLAELHEVTEPMPQYDVEALQETGFAVPPGWYGFVRASGVRLVEIAKLPARTGMDALRILGNPDLDSRSQEYQGRRLVRVNGGYIVLNYVKFLEKDHGSKERMRRFRARKKEQQGQQTPQPRRRRREPRQL